MYILDHNTQNGKLARLLVADTCFLDIALARFIDAAGVSEEQVQGAIAYFEAVEEYHNSYTEQ